MISDLFTKPVLIFGCGNTLFGDDGFGPEVIKCLKEKHTLPETVMAEDSGTGICDLLFDIVLAPNKPEQIFIVDAVFDQARKSGDIFEMELDSMPRQKSSDFCLHQFPSVNLLRELHQEAGVCVRILAVQAGEIPNSVRPGLSHQVRAAIPKACSWLLREINH